MPITDLLHTSQYCASCTFQHSLQNEFFLQCALCVWYTYHSYPYTQHTYFPIYSEELSMELYLDPCSTIHELTSLNMLNPLLQCILHCTHFLHLIEQLVLEHVCYGKV